MNIKLEILLPISFTILLYSVFGTYRKILYFIAGIILIVFISIEKK